MTQPPEEAINRREALRRAALLLGGTLSASAIAGVLAGCEASDHSAAKGASGVLTAAQSELVAAIADRIIPATDTPGARAAGVPRFIATMLGEYYTTGERNDFIAGLADIDVRAQQACGRAFVRCSPESQHALLEQIDRETFASEPMSTRSPIPFFRTMKELTVLGYYTSQVGATRELRYVQVPGRYDGCVPLRTIGRAWAV